MRSCAQTITLGASAVLLACVGLIAYLLAQPMASSVQRPVAAAAPGVHAHAAAGPLLEPLAFAVSPTDITCVEDPAQPGFQILYVVPLGAAPRADAPAQMREAVLGASQLLDHEARTRSGGMRGSRLRVRCSGGQATVVQVAVPLAAPMGVFALADAIKPQLAGLGLSAANTKFIALVEGTSTSGSPGIAQTWAASSTSALKDPAVNPSNVGGLFAAMFRMPGDENVYPATTLHEILHTLGAVNYSTDAPAPNATSFGHCTLGMDVMCYNDGSPEGPHYSGATCANVRVDCLGDSYFNPSPAAGSYLARNWNIATDAGAWLDYGSATSLPSPAQTIAVKARTSSRMTLAWTASASPAAWQIWVRTPGKSWVRSKRVGGERRSITLTKLRSNTAYRVAIYAEAADGALAIVGSPAATGRTRVVADALPRVRVVRVDRTSVTLAWGRPRGVRVAAFEIRKAERASAWKWRPARKVGSRVRMARVSKLRPGRPYMLALHTVDEAGNRSKGYYVRATTKR